MKPITLSVALSFLFLSCGSYHREWLRRGAVLDSIKLSLRKMERERKKEITELKADVGLQLEKIEEELKALSAKLEDLYQKEGRRIGPSVPESLPAESESSLYLSGEELYNQAYLDFTRGEYDLAIQGFQSYLRKFSNTELSDNAQYWIGECYYSKGDYIRAIEEFKKVEANYPQGNKVPAAIYKIGLTNLKLGQKKEGESYLKRVIKFFPNSLEAERAKEKLRE